MNYNEDTVKKAYRLHQSLMVSGEIQKEKENELYRLYADPDVREVLNRVFLPIAEAIIIKEDNTLYFVPLTSNDMFSYTNEELRILIKFKDNRELYFAQFIWMNVVAEFYGEQYALTGEPRSFIKVDEILNKVKKRIEKLEQFSEDERDEKTIEYQIDLQGMIDVWHNLSEVTDKVKDVSRATTRDYGFFLKVLNFWESEKWLIVKNKEEIVLTGKMRHVVGNYYHQETRINKIKELLNELD